MNKRNTFKTMVFALILISLTMMSTSQLFAVKKEFTLAAVGDCIITQKVSQLQDPRFLKVAELVRRADVTWGNCETTLFDPKKGSPAYKAIDPNLFCEPWAADEFKWLGIDLMNLANNHIMDFGKEGMFSTICNLERVGIGYAGAGKNLDEASRPGYIDTAAGRIGLVSCASWMGEKQNQAAPPHPHMNGRPGLNPINADWILEVDEKIFADLKGIRDKIIQALGMPLPKEEKEVKELEFGPETKFIKSSKTKIVLSSNEKDIERVIEAVKVARRNSRLVIVSLHEHIGENNQSKPTEYQEKFARRCIDAGADVFFGTGSHQLWGIEIYQGKPIFHGMGNLFFQELSLISAEAYQRVGLPADCKDPMLYAEKFGEYFTKKELWEGMVAHMSFDSSNKVTDIKLYPFVLGEDEPIFQRGLPRLADEKEAEKIIEKLKQMSAAYNTKIEFHKGIGRVIL